MRVGGDLIPYAERLEAGLCRRPDRERSAVLHRLGGFRRAFNDGDPGRAGKRERQPSRDRKTGITASRDYDVKSCATLFTQTAAPYAARAPA